MTDPVPLDSRIGYALVRLRQERDALEAALIAHRADLHSRSVRPCPTCRQSAEALRIVVPDRCAHGDVDRDALVFRDRADRERNEIPDEIPDEGPDEGPEVNS